MLRRRLVVTNPGSADLILSSATLTAPNMNLVSGGAADTLRPGELHVYELEYPASVLHDGGSLSYSTNLGGTVTHYFGSTPYISTSELAQTESVRAFRDGRNLRIEGLPEGAHAEWVDSDGKIRWTTARASSVEEVRALGSGTGILRWTLDGRRGVLKFAY
jgi:hypothetical protein